MQQPNHLISIRRVDAVTFRCTLEVLANGQTEEQVWSAAATAPVATHVAAAPTPHHAGGGPRRLLPPCDLPCSTTPQLASVLPFW